MKQYESYKDSGIEWLGKIPSHWKIVRFKRLFSFGRGLNITKADLVESGLPVISYGQIHSKKNSGTHIEDYLIRYVPDSYSEGNEASLAKRGDLLFADTSEDLEGCGNCVFVDKDMTLYAGYHTIIAKYKENNPSNYIAYLFKTDCWRSQLRASVNGVKVFSVTQNTLGETVVLAPPYSEQRIIASFLDNKVSQIDVAIAEKEKMIEDLQNYRKSIISETVTRGLDPNVPMKDSGIEWIGMIPEHWKMIKLKSIAKVNGRIGFRGYTSEDLVPAGEGAYTIGGKHITNCVVDLSNPDYISWDKYYESPEIMVKKGDILIAQRGSLGKAALVRDEIGEATINPSLVLLNNISIDNVFLYYYLISDSTLSYIDFLNTATAVPMVSQNQIENIKLPLPTENEQVRIGQFLDEKTSRIDSSISELQSQIEDLKAYKSSLITEAVTGKIDLRNE